MIFIIVRHFEEYLTHQTTKFMMVEQTFVLNLVLAGLIRKEKMKKMKKIEKKKTDEKWRRKKKKGKKKERV